MAHSERGIVTDHHMLPIYLTPKQRVFQSIFRPSVSYTLPTPLASPVSQSPVSQNPSFASTVPSSSDVENTLAYSIRAWHVATTFLTFSPYAFPTSKFNEKAVNSYLSFKRNEAERGSVYEALEFLNRSESQKEESGTEWQNLLDWYIAETRRHFLAWAESIGGLSGVPLETTLNRLLTVHAIYTEMLQQYVLMGLEPRELESKAAKYTRELNSIISYELEKSGWVNSVMDSFMRLCGTVLGVGMKGEDGEGDAESQIHFDGGIMPDDMDAFPSLNETFDNSINMGYSQRSVATEPDEDGDIHLSRPSTAGHSDAEHRRRPFDRALHPGPKEARAKRNLLRIWATLQLLGLGGSGRRGEKVFAEAIYNLITKYVDTSYSGVWVHPSSVHEEIDIWVNEAVVKLVNDVLSTNIRRDIRDGRTVPARRILSARANFRASTGRVSLGVMMDTEDVPEEDAVVKPEDIKTWKDIAVARLGQLRVSELFDIVVEWPDSKGGIQDLTDYLVTPNTRLHLTHGFNQAINSRLLHPGASTVDILEFYIHLIEAFAVLDTKGVLLDRVSRGIRRYLKEREDTLRIIVKGVFGAGKDGDGREDFIDLTNELEDPTKKQVAKAFDDFDYDDMNWVPDPIDAGADFKRSKGSDVVGSLLDLYENKETVVKEIQSYLASRLLEKEGDVSMESEIHTLELLKERLSGESAMQACDVMIKDLTDSSRMDAKIHKVAWRGADVGLHAKILSKIYWPRLKDDQFNVPPPIEELQKEYSRAFEKLNKQRKLVWVPAEGQVDVELELEDRIVQIPDVRPAFASVIYAFSSEDPSEAASRTVEQLEDQLDMETPTVKKALMFWCNKGILRETAKDTYTVISNSTEAYSSGGARLSAAAAAAEEEDLGPKISKEERVQYENFIYNMLTNSGKLGTAMIMQFFGMLYPGGCACGEEEMVVILEGMEERGVVREGEFWKIKK